MVHGLIPFLILALIVLVVAYVIIYVIDLIPGVPAPFPQIAKLIVGVIAFLIIVSRALSVFGIDAGL